MTFSEVMEEKFECDPSLVKHVGMVCDTHYIFEPNYCKPKEDGIGVLATNWDDMRLPNDVNLISIAHYLKKARKTYPEALNSLKNIQTLLQTF